MFEAAFLQQLDVRAYQLVVGVWGLNWLLQRPQAAMLQERDFSFEAPTLIAGAFHHCEA